MRIEVDSRYVEPRKVQRALQALEGGGLIAFAYQGSYALAADLESKNALERLRREESEVQGKGREGEWKLMAANLSRLGQLAILDDATYRSLRPLVPSAHWFRLPQRRELSRRLRSEQSTALFALPEEAMASALLEQFGREIAVWPAQAKGEAIWDGEELAARFPRVEVVLDAGALEPAPASILSFDAEEFQWVESVAEDEGVESAEPTGRGKKRR